MNYCTITDGLLMRLPRHEGRIFKMNKNIEDKRRLCKKLIEQISHETEAEVQLVEWKIKKSSEKRLYLTIEEILQSVNEKQILIAIENKNLVQRIIELARVNL